MGTQRNTDGDTEGHGWGNGDTGTRAGGDFGTWVGMEGAQRDKKGHRDGGYGDTART